MDTRDRDRRLVEPYAIAYMQWPAVVGMLEGGMSGWGLIVTLLCGAWVVLFSLAAIFGRRQAGPAFGLAMTLCAAMVGAAWASHPTWWTLLWLGFLPLIFFAAQRVRLDERGRPDAVSGPAQREGG